MRTHNIVGGFFFSNLTEKVEMRYKDRFITEDNRFCSLFFSLCDAGSSVTPVPVPCIAFHSQAVHIALCELLRVSM